MPSWVWNEEIAKGEEIVIFDLDGVISDASHRQHFLEKEDKDWNGFFAACPNDPPITSGVELTNLLSNIKSIISKIIWINTTGCMRITQNQNFNFISMF